jgi:predicted dehydrogenase
MTTRFGIALVGIGPGAQPHLRSLHDLQATVELRHAVTRRPAAADLGPFQDRLNATDDLPAALADPQVQAVLIATPPASHLDIARQCFAHGKHVLLEKPLDISLERAQAIVALARTSQRQLGVVLQFRFKPGAVALQEALYSGRLGSVQAASVRVPWWRPQSYYDQAGRGTRARDGGGVLLTQAIHSIDLFRALVGVRDVVAAQVSRTQLHAMETEDHASALLTLANGAPGHLMATTAMFPGLPESIEIIGSQGSAVLQGGALRLQTLGGEVLEVASEGGTGSGANIMDFSHDAHRAVLQDFVDAVRQGRPPRVTGEEALATHRVIDQVLQRAGGIQPGPPCYPPPLIPTEPSHRP